MVIRHHTISNVSGEVPYVSTNINELKSELVTISFESTLNNKITQLECKDLLLKMLKISP